MSVVVKHFAGGTRRVPVHSKVFPRVGVVRFVLCVCVCVCVSQARTNNGWCLFLPPSGDVLKKKRIKEKGMDVNEKKEKGRELSLLSV